MILSCSSSRKLFLVLLVIAITTDSLLVEAKGKKSAKNKKEKEKEIEAEETEIPTKPLEESPTIPPSESTTKAPEVSDTSTHGPSKSHGPHHTTTIEPHHTEPHHTEPHHTTTKPVEHGSSTHHPTVAASASTTTPAPSKVDGTTKDPDLEAIEKLSRDQVEEKKLLQAIKDSFDAWLSWIEKHDHKSLNRINISKLYNQDCDVLRTVYRDSSRSAFLKGAGHKQPVYHRAEGLHTITI